MPLLWDKWHTILPRIWEYNHFFDTSNYFWRGVLESSYLRFFMRKIDRKTSEPSLSYLLCKKKFLPSPFCAKSYCFPLCWRVKVLGVTKPEAFPQIPVSAIEEFGSMLARLINSHQIIFHISIPSNSKFLFEKSLLFLSSFLSL